MKRRHDFLTEQVGKYSSCLNMGATHSLGRIIHLVQKLSENVALSGFGNLRQILLAVRGDNIFMNPSFYSLISLGASGGLKMLVNLFI